MSETEGLLRLIKALFRRTQRLEAIAARIADPSTPVESVDAFDEAIRRLDACVAAHAENCSVLYARRLD